MATLTPHDLRRAAAILTASQDPAGLATAAGIAKLLAGANPRAALGLNGNWMQRDDLARRDEALRIVRAEYLPCASDRVAATAIAGAARNRAARNSAAIAQREAIRARLNDLGVLDAVPGERRIRQILADGGGQQFGQAIAHPAA